MTETAADFREYGRCGSPDLMTTPERITAMTTDNKQAISYDEAWRLAESAMWTFSSYCRYRFTFEAKAEGRTLRAVFGGDTGSIYRYLVTAEPMAWDKVLKGGDGWVQVLDGAGGVLWEGWPL